MESRTDIGGNRTRRGKEGAHHLRRGTPPQALQFIPNQQPTGLPPLLFLQLLLLILWLLFFLSPLPLLLPVPAPHKKS